VPLTRTDQLNIDIKIAVVGKGVRTANGGSWLDQGPADIL
jgi:hypothetical protein